MIESSDPGFNPPVLGLGRQKAMLKRNLDTLLFQPPSLLESLI